LQFFLGFLNTRHIVELHASLSFHLKAGTRAAKTHGPARSPSGATQNQHQAKHHHHDDQRIGGNPS
jgi:hypothetical protein